MPLWHWLAPEVWDLEPRTNPTFLVWDDNDSKRRNILESAIEAWGLPSSVFELRSAGYKFHVAVWGRAGGSRGQDSPT